MGENTKPSTLLTEPICSPSDGAPDCEGMLRVIAALTDSANRAMSGRSKRDNADSLEAMRPAGRDTWSNVEHRLVHRYRELREQQQ
jgi:hypothetical protein